MCVFKKFNIKWILLLCGCTIIVISKAIFVVVIAVYTPHTRSHLYLVYLVHFGGMNLRTCMRLRNNQKAINMLDIHSETNEFVELDHSEMLIYTHS